MSLARTGAAPRHRPIGRALWMTRALVFSALGAMSAPTSILLLGWHQRRMRSIALTSAGLPAAAPGWVADAGAASRIGRWFGGLAANVREGVMAFVSLGLATLPFTGLWMLAWWAGWENSFSKGYEQAFVGPMLALGGVAVFVVVMIFIPLGLAHQGVEGRALSLFELRRVRAVYRETGWGHVLLAAATVLLALPVFAGRGLVTFADGLVPGLDEMSPEDLSELAGRILLIKAAYLAVALMVLRGWSARIYAAAARRAAGRDPELWQGTAMGALALDAPPRARVGRWFRSALLMVVWFGLAAQIFVAQFLNHSWWAWLTHPFLLLPMAI